jgi:hypothetical protein
MFMPIERADTTTANGRKTVNAMSRSSFPLFSTVVYV